MRLVGFLHTLTTRGVNKYRYTVAIFHFAIPFQYPRALEMNPLYSVEYIYFCCGENLNIYGVGCFILHLFFL